MKFITKRISRSSCACSKRASGLDHKTFDDTMEHQSVVKPILSQCYEVSYGVRSLFRVKHETNVTFRGLYSCVMSHTNNVFLGKTVTYICRYGPKNQRNIARTMENFPKGLETGEIKDKLSIVLFLCRSSLMESSGMRGVWETIENIWHKTVGLWLVWVVAWAALDLGGLLSFGVDVTWVGLITSIVGYGLKKLLGGESTPSIA